MKFSLLFSLLLFTQYIYAQPFTELPQSIPFPGIAVGSVAFADVDGDTDSDLLITGRDSSNIPISKLYLNDGMGNFTEMTETPFEDVDNSSIAFADVDGDMDFDVLITGRDSSNSPTSKLYINDGVGNFIEVTDTPFHHVSFGAIAFADIDGDMDPDVFITGRNNSGVSTSKLYTNDGMGNFTEMMETPFVGVNQCSIAFADIDGDMDLDLLITGKRNLSSPTSKLYTNDGIGNFTEVTEAPFERVGDSSVAFADIDGDIDLDVLITGRTIQGIAISKLYINDGAGDFTETTEIPFDPIAYSSISFIDVDGDMDSDLFITGRENSLSIISKLFTNDGAGNFTEVTETPFVGVYFSSIAFADVDGDTDPDVFITGFDSSTNRISKLYTNDRLINATGDLTTEFELDFKTYPNPTRGDNLYLSYNSQKSGFLWIRVYDINGHLLSEQKEFVTPVQQTFLIETASLAPGNYFLQLDNGKRKDVVKFIIQ